MIMVTFCRDDRDVMVLGCCKLGMDRVLALYKHDVSRQALVGPGRNSRKKWEGRAGILDVGMHCVYEVDCAARTCALTCMGEPVMVTYVG